jgi:hypothetical protein
MVAGNSDGQWVQNMTTVRLASLQPIRGLVTLRTITLHPSVLEDGDSKFIRKVGQLPIRLYGFFVPEDSSSPAHRTNRISNISRENFTDTSLF